MSRRPLRGRGAPGVALALVALLGSATAQSERALSPLEKLDLEVHAWSPWPEQLTKGYQPIFVEIHNGGQAARTVEIEALNGWGQASRLVRGATAVGPGRSARLELFAPLNLEGSNFFNIEARVGGVDCGSLGQIGASRWYGVQPAARAGMVFAPRRPDPADVVTWATSLSWAQITARGTTGTPVVSGIPDNVVLGATTFDDLPRRFEAYTSLDFVVLDASGELPSEELLAPLAIWVRQGGTLVLLGPQSQRLAEQQTFAAWLEPRFRRATPTSVPTYSMGLGRVLWPPPAAAFADPAHARGLSLALREVSGWVLDRSGSNWWPVPGDATSRRFPALEIPDLDDVPYRSFALLLIVFTLVIGPLNFALVRRMGRPQLLLVTIPGIAFLATVGVVAYGLLSQGLEVRAAANSLCVLDQRAHRATSVREQLVFAGLTPGRLNPGAGTVVFAEFHLHRGYDPLQLEVDLRRNTELAGDYLPARRRVRQVLQMDAPARMRLDVTQTDGRVHVANGLGVTIEELALRAMDGGYYLLAEALAPDERAELVPAPAGTGPAHVAVAGLAPESFGLDAEPGRLLPGTWIALVDQDPAFDAAGVDFVEVASSHRILGVLDAAGEPGSAAASTEAGR